MKLKKLLALILACLLLTGCAAQQSASAPAEEPQEEVSVPVQEAEVKEEVPEEPVEEAPVEEEPAEEPEEEPVPEEPADEITFKEAEELMRYLNKLGPLGGDGFGGKAKQNVTVTEAADFIYGWKNDDVGMFGTEDVTAYDYLKMVFQFMRLKPEESVAKQAAYNRLLNGVFHMNTGDDESLKNMPVTREEAAQIVLNALGRKWTDEYGDIFEMWWLFGVWRNLMFKDEEFDGFSRPQVQWVKLGEGYDPVTAVYTPQPVYAFQAAPNTVNTCEIVNKVGFYEENEWVHFFHNLDGSFCYHNSKTHWNHADQSGCQAQYDLPHFGYGVTVEIYEYIPWESWAEYDDSYGNSCELFRTSSAFAYLGQITTAADGSKELAIYTSEDGSALSDWTGETEKWADYADGWYVFHVGVCNGGTIELVSASEIVHGTLTAVSEGMTEIDGEERHNSGKFIVGSELVMNPENVGNEYYFMMDQYGNVLGCMEENPVQE